MKYYDYEKAKQLIEKHKDELACANMGMTGDWHMTAVEVWAGGEYVEPVKGKLAGIEDSYWATPTIRLTFKDGRFMEEPCWIDEATYKARFGKSSEEVTPDAEQLITAVVSQVPRLEMVDAGENALNTKTVAVTPQEFAERMQAIFDRSGVDPERNHMDEDELKDEVLRSLGYGEGVSISENIVKWYA